MIKKITSKPFLFFLFNWINLISLLIPIIFSGCKKEDRQIADPIISLGWQHSALSPDFNFAAFCISEENDEKLYAYGLTLYNEAILSWDGNAWSEIIESLSIYDATDVQMFNNKIYVSSYTGLYQIEDTVVQLIFKSDFGDSIVSNTGPQVNAIKVFQDKLFVQGSLKIGETQSSISIYDGISFSSVIPGYNAVLLPDSDALYIQAEGALYQYDQNNLKAIKEQTGNIIRVHNLDLYSTEQNNSNQIQIIKGTLQPNGRETVLGDPFPSNIDISNIYFFGEIPIATGMDYSKQFLVAYSFQNNQWNPIPTAIPLSDIIEFNGKVLASANDYNTGIVELVKLN